MDPSLRATVVEIHPSAVYRGKVFTQDVRLVTDEDPEFFVYDHRRLVHPALRETSLDVALRVVTGAAVPSPVETRQIATDPEGQPALRGEVVELGSGDDADEGLLDVGAGTVAFDRGVLDGTTSVGDFLQITRPAVHLVGIEEDRSHPDRIALYRDRLDDEDPAVRAEAADYLGTLGSESPLPSLIQAARSDPDENVRLAAVRALGRIWRAPRADADDRDPRIRETLAAATDDPDPAVVEAARSAVSEID